MYVHPPLPSLISSPADTYVPLTVLETPLSAGLGVLVNDFTCFTDLLRPRE